MSLSSSPIDPHAPAVLMIGNFLSRHGLSRCACEEIEFRLRARGWTIYSTSRIRSRLPRLLDMLATTMRRAPQFQVASIDVFSGSAFLWAESVARLLRRLRKPYILILRGGALPDFLRTHPHRTRALLSPAAGVIVPSRFLQLELQDWRSDSAVIPNAVDYAGCTYRQRNSLQPNLVWLRAFHSIYDPLAAVRALWLLKPEFPNVALTMVGGDKGDGSLQETRWLATQLGVESSVHFTGAVPKQEVPHHLNQADIFLNTTTVDNTPVSVLEAMACGLCVVSTNPGGIPYLLQHETNALLTPVGQAHLTAAAVRRLLLEPELAAHISSAAHGFASQFDWRFVLPQWEQLFARVGRERVNALPPLRESIRKAGT